VEQVQIQIKVARVAEVLDIMVVVADQMEILVPVEVVDHLILVVIQVIQLHQLQLLQEVLVEQLLQVQ
jgi:hypothetical protein